MRAPSQIGVTELCGSQSVPVFFLGLRLRVLLRTTFVHMKPCCKGRSFRAFFSSCYFQSTSCVCSTSPFSSLAFSKCSCFVVSRVSPSCDNSWIMIYGSSVYAQQLVDRSIEDQIKLFFFLFTTLLPRTDRSSRPQLLGLVLLRV